MKDIIANLKTAIVYSKKPGNEGQSLANSKGIYRPIAEILTPAVEQLEKMATIRADLSSLADTLEDRQLAGHLYSILVYIDSENTGQTASAAKQAALGVK